MDLLNRVSMIGNLVADPQVREVGEGKLVADLRLALDPPGNKRKDTERPAGEAIFVDVELWDRMAENAGQYLTKGSAVLIEGRLKMDSWEDKQSGQRRSKLKVTGERMRFLPFGEGRGNDRGDRKEQSQDKGGDRRPESKREVAQR